MARLLVVDDEPSICWGLKQLGKRLGHEVLIASSGEQGLAMASTTKVDLVMLDVRLPGIDGLTAIKQFHPLLAGAPVVIMTAHGDLSTAVEAVRGGAREYLLKPFDLAQIERLLDRLLAQPIAASIPAVATEHKTETDGLVGQSLPMQEVFKRIALVSASEACVLLSGESGTGKELVARAIHRYSDRASGPFVPVNIAALNPSLVESELFGHARGSFTGADHAHEGLLLAADGGTLFLDEVADIPMPVQVKLLRTLDHGEVMPVGSGQTKKTRFRLISATHQDLPTQVAAGQFRHDLYYRLCTFQITLPPLRERGDDLALLAEYFASAAGRAIRFSPEAMQEIRSRQWPGNIRELRSAVEHALIVARDGVIQVEHLPEAIRTSSGGASFGDQRDSVTAMLKEWATQRVRETGENAALYDDLLRLVEPPLLEAVLKKCKGQCATAARILGMHRTTVRKKIDEYGLQAEEEE
jgi:two-component system, NtrC family, nitrogen regulation response regulator GlnG